jgi:flagellar protein FlgJ
MAVEFPSDLILDVARAADPARANAVEQRLARGESVSPVETTGSTQRLSRSANASGPESAAREFEALLVGNMITDMMGGEQESYFGGGFAGGVWKSMMAEQIAMAVVDRADFGVASMITGYFVRDGETIEPVGGISDAASAPLETRAHDSAMNVARELDQDFVRKMMDFNPDDGGK